MKVGLDTHQHEAGECYDRKIADHWEDGRNCGDPRCEYAKYVNNFKSNFGDEADILPQSFERWVHAKWSQENQGRLHAEAMVSLDN